ncbi:MAG: ATP-binding protein [Elusimicrobiota bacterium]|nr:ATP-binding protein [Elusimicrobiota bacterium]
MRLRAKAALAFLPMAAVFVLVVTVASRRGIEGIVLEEAVSRVQPHAVELASGLAPLFGRRESDILPHLQAVQAQTGADHVALYDASGRAVAHTNVLETGKHAPGSRHEIATAPSWERLDFGGKQLLVLSVPVMEPAADFLLSSPSGKRRLGELHVALPLERSLGSARRIADFVAALVAVFCLIALAVTMGLLQWLLGPVRQLSAATARIMAGDYGSKVPVVTKDEVGDLADSFNRMSDTLSRTTVSRDELAKALVIARGTVEAASEGILVYDLAQATLTYNQRFLEMWDISPDLAARGRAAMMERVRQSVEDPEEFQRRADEAISDSSQDHVDELRLKNGRVYRRTVRALRVEGVVFGRVLTFQDMTMLKESAQALERARDAAVQTARLKSEFLANMSHELRTPLNALVGSAELLRAGALEPAQRVLVEGIDKAAAALLGLVNGVLDFSKMEAGRMTAESIPFRLGDVLEDSLSIAQPRAAEKGLDLVCDSGDACREVLVGDPTRLRQILLNLLDNAVKFTPEGQVRLCCALTPGGGQAVTLELSVRDSGIGIDPAVLPAVFGAFTQADSSTTRRYGGTGLGLSISKGLVELLGGTIGADSEPGKGSTFWVRLPFERAVLAPGEAVPGDRRQPRSSPEHRRDRQRVLIVEDNAINRRLLLMQIEKLGRQADVAADGEAAVEAAARGDYGLILMDCQMPGIDGYEATRLLREAEGEKRRVPVVALTANAGETDRARCLAAGMDEYLAKPATLDDLSRVLDRWDLPFDAAAVKAYAALAAPDEAAFRGLVDDFIADSALRLGRARADLRAGDRSGMAAEVHAVKGAAAALGARGLRELCRRVEAAEKEGLLEEAAQLLAQADEELARVRDAGNALHV